MQNISVNLSRDFDDFKRKLAEIPGNIQVRFAITLTKIAVDAQRAAQDAFDKNYIQRSEYMPRGIVSFKATAKRLTAYVGTINYLMGLHLGGGVKPGAVAMEGVRGLDKQGKATGKLSLVNISRAIAKPSRKSKRFFTMFSGGDMYIMAKPEVTQDRQRNRKGKTKGSPVYARGPLTPMYNVRRGKRSRIRPDWKLYQVVLDRMNSASDQIMRDVLEDAWDHAVEQGRMLGARPNPYRTIIL